MENLQKKYKKIIKDYINSLGGDEFTSRDIVDYVISNKDRLIKSEKDINVGKIRSRVNSFLKDPDYLDYFGIKMVREEKNGAAIKKIYMKIKKDIKKVSNSDVDNFDNLFSNDDLDDMFLSEKDSPELTDKEIDELFDFDDDEEVGDYDFSEINDYLEVKKEIHSESDYYFNIFFDNYCDFLNKSIDVKNNSLKMDYLIGDILNSGFTDKQIEKLRDATYKIINKKLLTFYKCEIEKRIDKIV